MSLFISVCERYMDHAEIFDALSNVHCPSKLNLSMPTVDQGFTRRSKTSQIS